jgi:predicted metal-dependent enzyme (double-stranded beta helix superfamily)
MCDFVDRMAVLLDRVADPRDRARLAACTLRDLLFQDNVLAPAHLEPDPHSYRQHVVHVDPGGRFSVVSLVWLPWQRTPVHSHVCWCVVGVLEGQEEETRYRFDEQRGLVKDGTAVYGRGDVCWLVPPDRDIHHVTNSGVTRAVSLHIYGADIGKRGTSINDVYPDPD